AVDGDRVAPAVGAGISRDPLARELNRGRRVGIVSHADGTLQQLFVRLLAGGGAGLDRALECGGGLRLLALREERFAEQRRGFGVARIERSSLLEGGLRLRKLLVVVERRAKAHVQLARLRG